MSDDRAGGMSNYYKPSYNSDEDLDEDTQNKIRAVGTNSSEANDIRKQAWQNAGAYPKLKRMVKDAWSGDTHD
jgi:hypothetical protein